ncbi:MAG: wax ester/triacylglycerol synthase family O-acyltransferase [Myxococcales bacterium]|nr:wax ester/triacylglycerol synthase family O-acyltransferase [Myxococcales bacterium]
MPDYAYDRLSAQDNSFLLGETPSAHMHIAGAQIFELEPLRGADGGVDFEKVRAATEAVLHLIPRYRQKLSWIPLTQRPVWIDDPDFNLDYHIRHTSLPEPGSVEQLRRLASRIMGQQLDRERPLWETWVVEGLEGDRFALISKFHHCMIDGESGVDLAQVLLSIAPEYEIRPPEPYYPRPEPSGGELLRSELARRALLPVQIARGAASLFGEAEDVREELGQRVRAVGEMLGWTLKPASGTPLNGEIGPHRRVDWLAHSLADVKAVRRAAGATVNDVVLTTVTGALAAYLRRRGVDPSSLDFRISAPVSVRRDEEQGKMGNRVSSWIVRLPLDQPDPLSRLAAIHETTSQLKSSNQALGVDTIMQVAEWTPPVLLSLGAQASSGPINSIVTNVPGPQFPLYLLGARLLEMFPIPPLLPEMGLAIGLFSYDGRVFWGLNADYERVPDLDSFRRFIDSAFVEFAEAVDVKVETAITI